MTDPSRMLQVSGSRLIDGAGHVVQLAGVGLGGWMNMENFITGFPSTESLQRAALRDVLGEAGYQRFFDRFLTDFFGDADAAFLASIGVNALRVPFSYRHFEDDDNPFAIKEEGFRTLDLVVDTCARHKIYAILDLHAAPGAQNQHWHSDNRTHVAAFWQHRHFRDRVVHLWEALAEHYRDNPWVAGYNPLNEPADPSGTVITAFYRRLERAIRAIDAHHVLFLDANRYSTDFSIFKEPFDNVVYTAHDYALPGIAATGVYPGTTRGERFDRGVVETSFLRRTEFSRNTGTPIWIGEFGPIYTGDPARDEGRYRMLQDQLEIYQEHEASWSLWTYKDVGLQGLVYLPSSSAYVKRIRPALDKKIRLGADSWGGDDARVRDILDPVETLFAREFPDFTPYPWGQRQWIATLVRNILLAEPLVDDFARCFEGVSADEAEELAACFAFDNCVRRDELANLLRRQLAVSA